GDALRERDGVVDGGVPVRIRVVVDDRHDARGVPVDGVDLARVEAAGERVSGRVADGRRRGDIEADRAAPAAGVDADGVRSAAGHAGDGGAGHAGRGENEVGAVNAGDGFAEGDEEVDARRRGRAGVHARDRG